METGFTYNKIKFEISLLKSIRTCIHQSERLYKKTKKTKEKIVFEILKEAYDVIVGKLTSYQSASETVEFYLFTLLRISERNRLTYSTYQESKFRVKYKATKVAFTKLLALYDEMKFEMHIKS